MLIVINGFDMLNKIADGDESNESFGKDFRFETN